MDSGFDQNQSEFRVFVLSVSFQMLANLNGFLDKHVKILRDFGGESISLQNTNNLLSGDRLDLRDAVGVTQNNPNLRRSETLLGKLADVIFDICSRNLVPRRRRSLVREGTLGDTLSGSMHTTHAEKTESETVSL